MLHMLMNKLPYRSNNFGTIKPHRVKLISIESSIVFLVLKFYRHVYMTKLEFYKKFEEFSKQGNNLSQLKPT